MAELSARDLETIERGRLAFVARDRDAYLATWDPDIVIETLPDWPGPARIEGADAAWEAYVDVFAQFDSVSMEYVNIERHGGKVLIEVLCELIGLGSGAPAELHWTIAADFDSTTQRFTSARWFHTRDEAVAWSTGGAT